MPKHFAIYAITSYGKQYMRLGDDLYPIWNNNVEMAMDMEKAIAAAWLQILIGQEPLSTFGIEEL